MKVVSFEGALAQLMREVTAGRRGLLWPVGLRTFADPRPGDGGRGCNRALRRF